MRKQAQEPIQNNVLHNLHLGLHNHMACDTILTAAPRFSKLSCQAVMMMTLAFYSYLDSSQALCVESSAHNTGISSKLINEGVGSSEDGFKNWQSIVFIH